MNSKHADNMYKAWAYMITRPLPHGKPGTLKSNPDPPCGRRWNFSERGDHCEYACKNRWCFNCCLKIDNVLDSRTCLGRVFHTDGP